MSDKDFKVKNKLQVKGITSAGPVVSDASGNLDSTAYVATQYGGTGTSTSPSSGQILYSSSGTTYAPTDLSSLTISSSGGSTITNNSASAIGLVIKGAASQTANLTEWQTSAGAIIASIGPAGDVSVNGSIYTNNAYFGGAASYYNATINIRPQQTSYKGIVIQGRASQTGNLQEWQDSAGTVLGSIGAKGNISFTSTITTAPSVEYVVNASNPYPAFLVRTAAGSWINYVSASGTTMYNNTLIAANLANQIPLTVKGAASQTADLQQWQNSAGTVLAAVEPTGSFYGSSITAYGILTSNSSFRANNAAAGTVAAIIKGAASQTADLQQWQDSAGTVSARIYSNGAARFPYAITGAVYDLNDTTPYITLGSNKLTVNTRNAAYVGLTVQGVASQTANLQEWQNSAGTVLGSISATGKLTSAVDASINGITVGMGLGSISTNTAIGLAALGSNTTGSSNTALGDHAGTSNTSTVDNTYIGRNAGYYSYGNRNVFIGSGSAYNGGSGNNNTYLGTLTGTGNNYSGAVFIGYSAGQNTTGDNQLVIANTNTATPLIGGDFSVKTLSFAGNTTITSQAVGTVGLIVKGAASQTADLQQWQNSAGTVLAKIDKDGNFSNVASYGTITTTTLAATGGNITTTFGLYSNLPASTNAGIAVKPWMANIPGAIIRGYTSQTANLQEWQNSSGTVLASISAAGNLTVQDLTVNGTATTINSTTLTIDDKNIELASVASPTDTTADGAGITIKGATDKTFNWVQSTGSFTSSEPISTPALSVFGNSVSSNITLAAGKRYFVDTTAARTLTLPASPTLGDEIQVFDASNLAGTNNITLGSNSGKINGVVQDAILDTNGGATTLIYTGSSYGWRFE